MMELQSSASPDVNLNLDTLLIQLRPQVSSKWYQFGEAARIPKEVLEEFAKKCSPDDCIVEMLDYWLRNRSEQTQATWKDVASVLRTIDLAQLASDIEQVYKTGTLPVKVEMDDPAAPLESVMSSESTNEVPPPIPPKICNSSSQASKVVHLAIAVESAVQSSMIEESIKPPLPPKHSKMCSYYGGEG